MSRRANARRIAAQRANISQEVEVPAPIGGLNTRDNRGEMPLFDAISMENWIPGDESVIAREGYTVWADDLTGNVESLMPYLNGAIDELIVAVGTVWEKMSATALGASTEIETGLSNSRWQHQNTNDVLVAVNGVDAIRSYDGGTVTTPSFTGDIATPGSATMDGIHTHKNRMYLWDTDKDDFFFGATDAVSGAFSLFPLGSISKSGGNLITMKTLSIDAGNGMNDLAVFILSTGEVLVYDGSNPGDAADWVIVGRYKISPPIGVRSAVEFGGDIRVVTRSDTVSILETVRGEGKERRLSKLTGAIKSEVALNLSLFGWEAIWASAEDLIIYNVPNSENTTYVQYATNTSTGASTKFSGINANAFGIWKNEVYFGGTNKVFRLFDGQDDDGSNIALIAQQAFSTLGISQDKRMVLYQAFIGSEGDVSIGFSIAYNYNDAPIPSVTTSESIGAEWDVAEWDVAEWGGGTDVRVHGFSPRGTGFAVSAKISIDVAGQTPKWFKSAYVFDRMIARS